MRNHTMRSVTPKNAAKINLVEVRAEQEELHTSPSGRERQQQSSRGKLWAAFGVERFLRKCWEQFTIKSVGQNGVGTCRKCDATGDRRHEKPCKEELELLRHSTDLRFDGSLMRQAYNVGKSGDWRGFLENDKLSAWTERMLQ